MAAERSGEERPTRRPSIWERLFAPPTDTPDREPADWLFEDSTGYRIPFDRKRDGGGRDPDPEEGSRP